MVMPEAILPMSARSVSRDSVTASEDDSDDEGDHHVARYGYLVAKLFLKTEQIIVGVGMRASMLEHFWEAFA